MNTAADFLSRTEVNPIEKLEMSIRNDIQTRSIEVNIQSTGIVEEEQFYIPPDDAIEENQLWEEKLNVRNQARNETHNDSGNSITELQNFHKPTSGLNTCSEGHFKDYARIRNEQNSDIVLRILRVKLEGNPFDENDLASDYRYQHYFQNLIRIETKQEVLTRRYHTNTGTTHITLPNFTTSTASGGTPPSITWTSLKPPWHHQDESGKMAEILVPIYFQIH